MTPSEKQPLVEYETSHFMKVLLQGTLSVVHCTVPTACLPLGLTIVGVLLQFVFEAVRGRGYQSDIALDEIRFISGQCTAAQPIEIISPTSKTTAKTVPSEGVGGKYNTCICRVVSV